MNHDLIDTVCASTLGIMTGVYFIYVIYFHKK